MNKIQNLILLLFLIFSIQAKSQFFEYNNHLFSSKIAMQDSSKKGSFGLDMTTNPTHFSDKTFEIGALYSFYKDKREINSLSIISNLRGYFNNSYYVENWLDNGETDLAKDGYYISLGLIYQLSKRNFKFSYGIAPALSNSYQNYDAKIGFSSTMLFEYKRIMLITNLSANQFNENSYISRGYLSYVPNGPYSIALISSYFSSALFFELNPDSDERIYIKFLNTTTSESNKLAIGLSLPIDNVVIINPEIAYNTTDTYFTSEKPEYRLTYGFLGKVRIANLYLKSFVTYHIDKGGEDLNINFGIEYNL